MYVKKPQKMITVFFMALASGSCLASGAFNPSVPGPVNAQFALGKSIVTGRKGDANCAGCHAGDQKFKRNGLKSLGKPISKFIVDCTSHQPCFEGKLTAKELSGIDSYFKRRYRIK